MDGTRFDDLVRALLGGAAPRRRWLRLSALPLAGGLAAFLVDDDESEAKKRKNKKKKRKRKRKNKKKGKAKVDCSAADVCASGCPSSSVQDAIDDAEPGATIILCAGTFTGNLTIEKDLTLLGAGEGDTILQGDGTGTVVTIEAGTVSIEQLRITGGAGAEFGGGIYNGFDATLQLTGCTVSGNNTDDGRGNGIYNESTGTLTVDDCTIGENGLEAPGAPWGGAIHSEGALTVTNSALTGNRAAFGAGLYAADSSSAELTGCDISDNEISDELGEGAAIYNDFAGSMTVTDCTIRNNSGARRGGAVTNLGPATFTNCEISGHSASEEGGGIFNDGRFVTATLTLDNTDVMGNSAGGDGGGGIYNLSDDPNDATVTCTNGSTVSNNGPDQCVDAGGGTGCDTCAP